MMTFGHNNSDGSIGCSAVTNAFALMGDNVLDVMLQGLWTGCFGTHGHEIMLLRFVPAGTPNPFRCPATRVQTLATVSYIAQPA